ncbi:hypothetical protein LOZ80_21060 [Paenibacillus sp. HWE-109]|uniref:hypothetical protein n=1 Tax=Paenibacillus sp. HWE-109 TaxID=1306526 RepID=UPI001EE13815|nr:hypothetical protein [Paenibacillus sp. HWE-109]UKS24122.1 hypothetical protein LOZ80_21060 [Paenibacillus sp. HWE-109]
MKAITNFGNKVYWRIKKGVEDKSFVVPQKTVEESIFNMGMIKKLVFQCLLFTCVYFSFAAVSFAADVPVGTYYVDSTNGNDAIKFVRQY